ncbi:hypothetical protein CHLRE_11g467749v5 [Chlamydomonas reinhardtii]|uniref:Uncharacterized protein n=1 Tax=Chlamydomonas reinhardtii TaxID=3055 RepID=A0A2K3D7W7_CHLRE|nr:uncharacterized protein CHLRE_11g467749v5 [Chlamydomonas reinhardtii]PNW76628.1 hypothetical protein CHLRE_11g467749v5 [Chlamydomonas reinhardtii]
MQGLRGPVLGGAPHQQVPACSSFTALVRPLRCRGVRMAPRLSAVSESANGKVRTKQLRFYYFDPANPEDVREVVAKQQDSKSGHHHNGNGNTNGYANGNGNGNGVHISNGHTIAAPTQLVVKEAGKDSMQLQRLSTQLEEARAAVAKLQQYEVLYKESRMRTKQMQAEVTALQQLLADKDAELARQYKRMENEAMERSGLRSQFTTAVDEVKSLRNELEEARQAMLELRGVIPPNVITRRGAPRGALDESAAVGLGKDEMGSPDVLASLQGLAKQLAEGMEQEVGSLFGGSGKRD